MEILRHDIISKVVLLLYAIFLFDNKHAVQTWYIEADVKGDQCI